MIKHIVMWKLKDESLGNNSSENAKKIKEILEALPLKINEITHLEVSCDIITSKPEATVVLYSEFASKEDLEKYAVHPEHVKCGEFIREVVAERFVMDYII